MVPDNVKMVSVGTILVSAATTYEFLGHTQQSDQPKIETSPHIVTNEISWLRSIISNHTHLISPYSDGIKFINDH